MSRRLCEIREKDYLDKKFEAAKEIFPMLAQKHDIESLTDKKKRASIIYNTVALADDLLRELGYTYNGQPKDSDQAENTAIKQIGDMIIERKSKK